jgi:phage shock protein PspC (stress-responsive transcriptional regulator)
MDTAPGLTRSRSDRMLAGVIGGIARRYGWNSNLLRAIYVVVSIASAAFPGIIVYIALWLLVPEGATPEGGD